MGRKKKIDQASISENKKEDAPQLKPTEEPLKLKEKTETTESETDLINHPVIKNLTSKVEAFDFGLASLTAGLQEFAAKYEQQETKITNIAKAIELLNNEFTNFMNTLQTKLASTQTPIDANRVISSDVLPGEPTKLDKIINMINTLAQIAPVLGNKPPAADNTGGYGSFIETLKIMGELRKTFLGEFTESVKAVKQMTDALKGLPPTEEKHLT